LWCAKTRVQPLRYTMRYPCRKLTGIEEERCARRSIGLGVEPTYSQLQDVTYISVNSTPSCIQKQAVCAVVTSFEGGVNCHCADPHGGTSEATTADISQVCCHIMRCSGAAWRTSLSVGSFCSGMAEEWCSAIFHTPFSLWYTKLKRAWIVELLPARLREKV
jgi:hypothetical protein